MADLRYKVVVDETEARKKLRELLSNTGVSNPGDTKAQASGIDAVRSATIRLKDAQLANIEALRQSRLEAAKQKQEQADLNARFKQGQIDAQQFRLEQAKLTAEQKAQAKASRELKKQLEANSEYSKLTRALNEVRKKSKDVLAEMYKLEMQGGKNSVAYAVLERRSRSLVQQTTILDNGVKRIDATVGQHQRNVGNYASAMDNMIPIIGRVNRQLAGFGVTLDDLAKKPGAIKEIGSAFVGLGKNLLAFVASPVGIVMAAVAGLFALFQRNKQTIIDFNSGLRDISKTTDIVGKDLRSLGGEIVDLSMKLKVVDATKLTEYAAIAGQLGVKGRADILAFTESLAMLETASDIAGENGGKEIARMLTLVDGGVQNVKAFGDEIVNLGNNFAASEREILGNAEAISQNVGLYRIGRRDVLAYATATKSLGVEAEVVGSTFQKTLGLFEKSIRSGKGVADILRVVGGSATELQARFKTDASGVFQDYIKGLNDIHKAGGSVQAQMERNGIVDIRHKRVIGTLATGYDTLARAMETVQDANGAMQAEFENGAGKLEQQSKRMGIAWDNFVLSIEDGEGAIGRSVVAIIGFFADLLDQVNKTFNPTSLDEFLARLVNFDAADRIREINKSMIEAEKVVKRVSEIDLNSTSQQQLNEILTETTSTIEKLSKTFEKYKKDVNDGVLTEGGKNHFKDFEETLNFLRIRQANMLRLGAKSVSPSPIAGDDDAELDEKAKRAAERAAEVKRRAVEKQRSLQLQIDRLNEQALRSQLSRDSMEVASIRDKYAKIREEARKFYADPKNKGLRVDMSGLDRSERSEVDAILGRQLNDKKAKRYQEDYQNYLKYERLKVELGEKSADEQYGAYKDALTNMQVEYAALFAKLSAVGLSNGESELMKSIDKIFKQQKIKTQEEFIDLLKTHQTYEQRRQQIITEGNKKVALLQKAGRTAEADQVKKALDDSLRALAESNLASSEIGKKAARDVFIRTREEMKDQVRGIEEILNNGDISGKLRERLKKDLATLKISLNIGARDTNIQGLEEVAQNISNAISKYMSDTGIKNISDDVLETNPKLRELYDRLREINEQIAKLKRQTSDGTGVLGFLKKLEGNEALKEIAGWGDVAASSFMEMSEALGGTNTQAGHLLATMGELAESAADLASAIASGSPKSIVKSTVSAVSSLFSISKRTKEMNRQARAEVQKFYDEAKRGEIEYQALLRKRELDTASRGKSSYRAIIDQLETIKKQAPEVQKAYDKIFNSLQGEEFVEGQGYKHGTWFRKAKTWDIMASLAGSDYERLERLYSEGKLVGTVKEDFEALRALRDELEDAGLSVQDLQDSLNQLLTGTTASGLASGLLELFENGKRSAADFGKSFEDILRTSVKSAFQAKYLDDAMTPFYDSLASMMKDGNLTDAQIENLRQKYIALGEEYAKQWEDIEKVVGKSDTASQIQGRINRNISETTGSEILGFERARYDIAKNTYDLMGKQAESQAKYIAIANDKLASLNAIQVNTANTVARLDLAVGHLQQIVRNTGGTTGRTAEGMGI